LSDRTSRARPWLAAALGLEDDFVDHANDVGKLVGGFGNLLPGQNSAANDIDRLFGTKLCAAD